MAMSRELKHNDQKAVLYDVEWQVMRVDMLGSWNIVEAVTNNIATLKAYVTEVSDLERYRRSWRVLNYYNAIRMGYHGQGLVGTSVDLLLIEGREDISQIFEASKLIYDALGDWDWNKVKDDLTLLYSKNKVAFNAIMLNLTKRQKFASSQKRGVNIERTRRELCYFVDLMRAVRSISSMDLTFTTSNI